MKVALESGIESRLKRPSISFPLLHSHFFSHCVASPTLSECSSKSLRDEFNRLITFLSILATFPHNFQSGTFIFCALNIYLPFPHSLSDLIERSFWIFLSDPYLAMRHLTTRPVNCLLFIRV